MRRGFTLIELMVVVAIATVLLVLAAPSFIGFIEGQRLRSMAAQFSTDVQFARSEAVSRQRKVYLSLAGGGVGPEQAMSCYIVFTCPTADVCNCDCTAGEGQRCMQGAQELRTQQILGSLGVRVTAVPSNDGPAKSLVVFEPTNGGLEQGYQTLFGVPVPAVGQAWSDMVLTREGVNKRIRTQVNVTGRPSQCSPDGSVTQYAPC